MKQTGVCPKCNSTKIGFLENIIQRTVTEFDSQILSGRCPAPVGINRSESGKFLKVIREEPVGELEAYLCGSCGFFETYIKEPESIEYESMMGFKWITLSQ